MRESAERKANEYARNLAISLHDNHCQSVEMTPLPDRLGLMTRVFWDKSDIRQISQKPLDRNTTEGVEKK